MHSAVLMEGHVHTDRIPGKSNISSMSSESLTPIPWPPFSSSSSLSLSASASSRRCFSWDNYHADTNTHRHIKFLCRPPILHIHCLLYKCIHTQILCLATGLNFEDLCRGICAACSVVPPPRQTGHSVVAAPRI